MLATPVNASIDFDKQTINHPKYSYEKLAEGKIPSHLQRSYNYLKAKSVSCINECLNRFPNIKEKIFSGLTLNEEIGLNVALFKYGDKDDYYMVADVTDSRLLLGKLKLGNKVIIGQIEYAQNLIRLKELLNQNNYEPIHDNLTQHIGCGRPIKPKWDNNHSFHLFVGINYYEKDKGISQLIYSMHMQKFEKGTKISGKGNGELTLENYF